MLKTGLPAARNAWMRCARWRNCSPRCGESPPGTTLRIWRRAKPSLSRIRRTMRGPTQTAWSCRLWEISGGGQIRPHHVLAHRVPSGTVFDRVLSLLGQVRVFDLRLFASASGLADTTARRVIGQLLERSPAVFDGLRVASKDLRDVAGAAMSQCDRFECGKAAAVLF